MFEDLENEQIFTDSLEFSFSKIQGDTLTLLEVKEEDNTDPYKKYGYEFNGHCYACDAANVLIDSTSVQFINACGSGDIIRLEMTVVEDIGDGGVRVTTNSNVSIFLQRLEEYPIYRIKIEGELGDTENLRVGELYTTKTALLRFEIQNCGDFDG